MKYMQLFVILGLCNATVVTAEQAKELTPKTAFQYTNELPSENVTHPAFRDIQEQAHSTSLAFDEKNKSDIPERFKKTLANASGMTASGRYVAPGIENSTVEGNLNNQLMQNIEPAGAKFDSLKIKTTPVK